MELNLTALLIRICRWYLSRHFSESNTASEPLHAEEPPTGIFQPPVLTIVFREGQTEEEAIKSIADIYMNRNAYSPPTGPASHQEREYLKYNNIKFEKLKKITL